MVLLALRWCCGTMLVAGAVGSGLEGHVAQDGAGGRYAEAGELHGLVAGHGCMLAVLLVTVLLSLLAIVEVTLLMLVGTRDLRDGNFGPACSCTSRCW